MYSTSKGLLAITRFPNNPRRFSGTTLYTIRCSSLEGNPSTTGTPRPTDALKNGVPSTDPFQFINQTIVMRPSSHIYCILRH